ncbi:M15 family metallopeptidase [Pararhodobacter sp. SW119]|uniref:M15 family metallopeptidase n=1 Tax=Pararhodobacter sp. SW119 TaxID=2780075 RepID=UPI001AE01658|nr:M15 family metallopeptidase [Pararhodobacter sp. SW119]
MRVVPVIILAIAIVLAPVLWFVLQRLDPPGAEGGRAVDSGARIEIEMLRQQIENMQIRIDELENRIAMRPDPGQDGLLPYYDRDDPDADWPRDTENTILDSYAQVVVIPTRRSLNEGMSVATPGFLQELLGRPRPDLSDDCQPMTNPDLREMLVIEEVGPIRVQMLRPAVESLRRVFAEIRRADPDLYERIGTAGSLCVRQIRGTRDRLSSHSFGTAVDLNIDGRLDAFGAGTTQLGLTILADFFAAEGWIWGAAFGREDSMHFEVSREKLLKWREEGRI